MPYSFYNISFISLMILTRLLADGSGFLDILIYLALMVPNLVIIAYAGSLHGVYRARISFFKPLNHIDTCNLLPKGSTLSGVVSIICRLILIPLLGYHYSGWILCGLSYLVGEWYFGISKVSYFNDELTRLETSTESLPIKKIA